MVKLLLEDLPCSSLQAPPITRIAVPEEQELFCCVLRTIFSVWIYFQFVTNSEPSITELTLND